MIFLQNLIEKKIGVLGLGITGSSVIASAIRCGANVVCWDDDQKKRDEAKGKGYDLVDLNLENELRALDLLLVSPGIAHLYPDTHEILKSAYRLNIEVDNDIGLFFSHYLSLDYEKFEREPKVIAITGSNGKSTVTALAGHVLSKIFNDVKTGGNIGNPVLEFNKFESGSIRLIELSSYQIERAQLLNPDVAIFLNFSPDHGSRHGGKGGYFYSKALLITDSSAEIVILNIDTNEGLFLLSRLRKTETKILALTNRKENLGLDWVISTRKRFLTEWKNGRQIFSFDIRSLVETDLMSLEENLTAVYAIARSLGVAPKKIFDLFKGFKPLPHRNQLISTIKGVKFINDSKSTNVASAEYALQMYKNIHWIAGGQPKDDDFSGISKKQGNIKKAYLIGEAGHLIKNVLDKTEAEVFFTLEDAFKLVLENIEDGDTVLFSPACASFDQYLNFEARGQHFIDLTNQFKKS